MDGFHDALTTVAAGTIGGLVAVAIMLATNCANLLTLVLNDSCGWAAVLLLAASFAVLFGIGAAATVLCSSASES